MWEFSANKNDCQRTRIYALYFNMLSRRRKDTRLLSALVA